MKTRWMVALSVGVAAAAVVPSAAGAFPSSTGVAGTPGAPGNASNAGPPEGLVHPRDDAGSRSRSNANMTYHGGVILTSVVEKTIFWGTSWPTDTSDKVKGIGTFYAGEGGSNYAMTVDEYTSTNGQVGPSLTAQGSVIDGSTAAGGGNTSTILAEVQKQVTAKAIIPVANGFYPVYTDVPRGSAGYCAYHSYGPVTPAGGGPQVTIQFAYFFNLDGDPGCDPGDTSGLHSQGLAALANVSAHELSEARSDPASPGAWYDGSGAENGDKCAWTFGAPLVTFANGTQWKAQGEWSNAAYAAGTGYPNSSGQKGCLSGL